jgi:hypothetical protein
MNEYIQDEDENINRLPLWFETQYFNLCRILREKIWLAVRARALKAPKNTSRDDNKTMEKWRCYSLQHDKRQQMMVRGGTYVHAVMYSVFFPFSLAFFLPFYSEFHPID